MSDGPAIPVAESDTVQISDRVTRQNKVEFADRFNKMVMATGMYGGDLSSAWATAEPLDGNFSTPQTPELSPQQTRQVAELVRRIKNAGITTAVIEAAHMYMYDNLDASEVVASVLAQCRDAVALTAALKDANIQAHHILFVDDYNPPPHPSIDSDQLDIDGLIELTQSAGYRPQLLLREGSMVKLGKQMISYMDTVQGLVQTEKEADDEAPAETEEDADEPSREGRMYLKRRSIELYRPEDDMVSCAMLDAALTVVKFRNLGEGVVNVLPRRPKNQQFSYNGQQRKMRTILGEHLGMRTLPIFNVFTGVEESAAGAHHVFRKPR